MTFCFSRFSVHPILISSVESLRLLPLNQSTGFFSSPFPVFILGNLPQYWKHCICVEWHCTQHVKMAKRILMFEMFNGDRMSTWKVKAVPSLSTKVLTVQFSCQDVIFQVQGACSGRIIGILLATALLSNMFEEEQRNSWELCS